MAYITQFGYENFNNMKTVSRFIVEGKYVQAIKFARICFKHSKDDTNKQELIAAIVKSYMAIGEYAFANKLTLTDELVKFQNCETKYMIAMCLFYTDEFISSEEYYLDLTHMPETPQIADYMFMLRPLYTERRFAEIEEKYKLKVYDESYIKRRYLSKVIAMIDREDYKSALKVLSRFIDKVPNDLETLELILLVFLEVEDITAVEKFSERVLSLNSKSATALKSKIVIGQKQGNTDVVNSVLNGICSMVCEDIDEFINIIDLTGFIRDKEILTTFVANNANKFGSSYIFLHISFLLSITMGDYKRASVVQREIADIYGEDLFQRYAAKYLRIMKDGNALGLPLMDIMDEINNLNCYTTPYLQPPLVYENVIDEAYATNNGDFCKAVVERLDLKNFGELFELLVSTGREVYLDEFFDCVLEQRDIFNLSDLNIDYKSLIPKNEHFDFGPCFSIDWDYKTSSIAEIKYEDTAEVDTKIVNALGETLFDENGNEIDLDTILSKATISCDKMVEIIDKLDNNNLYVKGYVISELTKKFNENTFLVVSRYRVNVPYYLDTDPILCDYPVLYEAYRFAFGICCYISKFFEGNLRRTALAIEKIFGDYVKEEIDYRIYAAAMFYFLNAIPEDIFETHCYTYFRVDYEDVITIIDDIISKDKDEVLKGKDVIIDRLDSYVGEFQYNLNK